MRKAEIARKFDEIVEFSGCARYIDTPVKRYSSGMYVRLAFAVAAHLEPEILIVDEVLAVGDAEFQKKCLGKMKDVAGHGRTILFVSHNMAAMQKLCDRCILMKNGQLEAEGETKSIIKRYLGEERSCMSAKHVQQELKLLPKDDVIEIEEIKVTQNGEDFPAFYTNDIPFFVFVTYRVKKRTESLRIALDIIDEQGDTIISTFHDENNDYKQIAETGLYKVEAKFPSDLMAELNYGLVINATIHCVRMCMGDGIKVKMPFISKNGINRIYEGQPCYGKIQPRVCWESNRLE
jgi:lipopolysaccharide transport system ATP-binding protein